jgi:23S rRNA (adenine2030-N6)-methyltransferase
MFSYRHAFHAGNHADVLKHITLLIGLELLKKKETGITLIDTHAGAGIYSLEGDYAIKSGEASEGVLRLASYCTENPNEIPDGVVQYLHEIAHLNHPQSKSIKTYPGSSQLLLQAMRVQDQLKLIELHTTDYPNLVENMTVSQGEYRPKRSVQIFQKDGFAQLKAYLPPPTRRGLCLIDPSYENKDDYQFVLTALKDAIKRFATGAYFIWYPILQRRDATELPHQLAEFCKDHHLPYLQVELQIKSQILTEGLAASGMWVINPPWQLKEQLALCLPFLVKALGQDDYSRYELTAND